MRQRPLLLADILGLRAKPTMRTAMQRENRTEPPTDRLITVPMTHPAAFIVSSLTLYSLVTAFLGQSLLFPTAGLRQYADVSSSHPAAALAPPACLGAFRCSRHHLIPLTAIVPHGGQANTWASIVCPTRRPCADGWGERQRPAPPVRSPGGPCLGKYSAFHIILSSDHPHVFPSLSSRSVASQARQDQVSYRCDMPWLALMCDCF